MFQRSNLSKYTHIVLLGILLHITAVYARADAPDHSVTAVEESTVWTDTVVTQTITDVLPQPLPSQGEDAENNFDKIRRSESYDPATDQWSLIEDFKTVEILTDTTQTRETQYIYHNFWAYNPITKHWYKVDIRNYGYKFKMGKQGEAATSTDDEAIEEENKRDSAWKNLGFNISLGGGGTWYEHKPQGLDLIVRNREYFLQAKSDKAQDRAHVIRWFRNRYKTVPKIFLEPVAYSEQAKETVGMNKNFGFRGIGVSLPITVSLHYTFFKRLRLGLGSNFEINYLKKLKLTGDASHIAAYELRDPWIYNLKWFGVLGYKIMRKPTSALVLDTHVGMVYDVGPHVKYIKLFPPSIKQLYNNWFAELGLGYEKKLNNYLKFTTRLSFDYKNYDDAKSFSKGSTVKLYQIGTHLDIGLTFNFAKDTGDEDIIALDELYADEPSTVSNTDVSTMQP